MPGVKKVNIIGEQAERIFVEFSYDRLATLGVSPTRHLRRAQQPQRHDPAGSIEAKGPQIFIRLDGAIDDLQEIRNTAVAAQGRTLKLADIAEVKRLRRSGDLPDPQQRRTDLAARRGHARGWNGLDLGKALDAEARRSTRACRSA